MKTIETLDPKAFRGLITTIGELPSSFVDSMSYYEMIAWLVDYIKNNVIPAVNNNAEAIKEIQKWIETLDLQDEVDNKLDEMADSGELAEIISQYLNSTAIFGYDTVASMKAAVNLIDGSYARTLGYYSANDGGGALYKIRTRTYDDTIDEGSIILLSDSLVAELIINNATVNIKQFGCYGNDSNNDTTAIQNAINFAENKKYKVFIPEGIFLVSHLTIDETLCFIGNGYKSTLKSIEDNTAGSIITLLNDGLYKSEIANFSIEGNNANNSNIINGINLYVNSEGTSRDTYTYIHNITINRCTGDCITSSSELNGADIREVTFENLNLQTSNKCGMKIRNCSDSRFSFITINTCLEYGFDIASGPHKIVSCKAFYCGKGDETTIEDINRLPANAFDETADETYNPLKTYYTRSGNNVNNDWYVFTQFTGTEFAPDTTYYERVKDYFKRYAGFIIRGSDNQIVDCEAQENYGDGIVLLGSDHSLTNIAVDNNGFLPNSYASLGYWTLYYGIYCTAINSIINGVGRNLRVTEYGSQQRSVLMLENASLINANLTASSQALDYVVLQNSALRSLNIVYKGKVVGFECLLSQLTNKTAGLTFANARNNITLKNGVVYIDMVMVDSTGFATNTTEKTLFSIPEAFRPNGSVIGEAYLSTADGWAINDKTCQFAVYSSGTVKTRARNSSETSSVSTLMARLSYPIDVTYR